MESENKVFDTGITFVNNTASGYCKYTFFEGNQESKKDGKIGQPVQMCA